MKVIALKVGAIQTNCYIGYNPDTGLGFIVDPGGNSEKIIRCVRDNKLNITDIVITHGHFDHILALHDVKVATGAEVIVHDADKMALASAAACLLDEVSGRNFKSTTADLTVKGGEVLSLAGEAVRILYTPGHSAGSICLDTGEILFSGDTLFAGDCGRCDLPGGDYDVMMSSLACLYRLDGERIVYPGHDESTTLSHERIYNRSMLQAINNNL